jgi:hypothetical protein
VVVAETRKPEGRETARPLPVVARHAMNLVYGLLILALLVSMLAAMYADVEEACREAILDELWDEDT